MHSRTICDMGGRGYIVPMNDVHGGSTDIFSHWLR